MSSGKEAIDKRKASQSTESTISTVRSPSPTPDLVAFEAEISQPNNPVATPAQDPPNSNRSITPPTISPLSKRSPLTESSEDPEEGPEEPKSESLSPEQTRAAVPRKRKTSNRIPDDDDEYEAEDSSSSSSPTHSQKKDVVSVGNRTADGRVALPENKPIVFKPYFKRSGFIPAPQVTGNEAWAKNRVWNDEKKKYEIVDLEKIAKY